MPLEWDDNKAKSNLVKHGISFDEAASVLQNKLAAEASDPDHSATEHRWLAIGHSNLGRLLVVSYVDRPDAIRIISARKATKKEIKNYESYKKFNDADTLRPEYDFDYSKVVRGKSAARLKREGSNIVVLKPDVINVFPDSASVNEALRSMIEMSKLVNGKKKKRAAKAAPHSHPTK